MKRMVHYALYPLWWILYSMGIGIYSDESYARRIDRTTWKYGGK